MVFTRLLFILFWGVLMTPVSAAESHSDTLYIGINKVLTFQNIDCSTQYPSLGMTDKADDSDDDMEDDSDDSDDGLSSSSFFDLEPVSLYDFRVSSLKYVFNKQKTTNLFLFSLVFRTKKRLFILFCNMKLDC